VNEVGIPLRFTEIMSHPPGGEAYEFIELQQLGALPLNVSGFSLRGVEFLFPATTVLPPGAIVVLASAANPAAFEARYPATIVLGTFGGSLDNGGERLAVVDRDGRIVTAVHFDDEGAWPVEADGAGYSLEVVDPRGDPSAPANWRASDQTLGSPGRAPMPPPPPAVLLNEVMADNRSVVRQGDAFPDWVELHNPGVVPSASRTGASPTTGTPGSMSCPRRRPCRPAVTSSCGALATPLREGCTRDLPWDGRARPCGCLMPPPTGPMPCRSACKSRT